MEKSVRKAKLILPEKIEKGGVSMEEKKVISEMTDHELLVELVEQQQSSSRNSKILVVIMAIIAAVAVIAAAFVVPKAMQTLNEANTIILQGEETLTEVDGIIADIAPLTKNANSLIEDNSEAVTEAMNNIKNIDFDSLNRSIKNLADVLQPLAEFFNIF